MSLRENRCYEFGPFRLDAAEGQLLRAGQEIPLTPKAFKLLHVLVENAGHVLDKDALMERVWSDSVVEEKNLADNISTLRKALGDDPKEPRYIKTVQRRGYRFVADVRKIVEAGEDVLVRETELARLVVEEEQDSLPASDSGAPEVAPRELPAAPARRRFRPVFLGGVLVFAVSLALSAYALRKNSGTGKEPLARSIAVLPFKPLVATNADPALELGITDALISKLSNIRQIVVRPTNSVLKYAAEGQDLRKAGSDLGVDVILDGRVQKVGERIRLSVQLVRAADGVPIWAEKFDEEFRDVFAVQDAISERVASALALRLTGEEKKGLAKRYTDNVEAYQLYLKGRQHWSTFNQAELLKSVTYYHEALKIDPNYALAYTGLADAYSVIGIYGPLPTAEAMPKSGEAARKALSLDETLAEAHTALGAFKILYERDWPGAEREFKRALELNPNFTDAHNLYGYYLQAMGRMDAAVAEIKRAKELAPTWFIPNRDYLLALVFARRYDETIELGRHVTKLEPDDFFTYGTLGRAHTLKGEFGEGEAALQRAVNASRERPGGRALSALGYLYAVTGRRDEALKIIEQLKEKPVVASSLLYIAQIYAGLGDRDRAFAALDEAYKEHYPMLWRVKVEPEFDLLRDDERYAVLLRQMNLTP